MHDIGPLPASIQNDATSTWPDVMDLVMLQDMERIGCTHGM